MFLVSVFIIGLLLLAVNRIARVGKAGIAHATLFADITTGGCQ
jgi:hypothetical protein